MTVADLVEAAVARDPGAVAVVAGDETLTYAEFDARANRLAHYLREVGVGPGRTVGVSLHRSSDLAVALLAVLKAGGACVPLDPAYPAERLALLAEDAVVTAVLTRSGIWAPAGIRIDVDRPAWADRPATAPARTGGLDDVAYVVYTSGSTGRPKGVALTHRGLVNHHRAVVDLYGLGPGDRVLQFCSLGFDASIEELFPTWAAGATVVFRPEDRPLLGPDWLAWLADQRISVMNLPTAYWHAWTADLDASGATVPPDVRLVVVGGERASGGAYRAWARVSGGHSRWINAYGPTETTCMSTYFEPPSGWEPLGDPPIGRPLRGTTIAVVDDALGAVRAGETGELLIGGAGVARGYLNAPELTAERFVELGAGGRTYRTGDLVRELADGNLAFVGRLDDQVKIRGFRVECGEVEATLRRHPAVRDAAVVARDDGAGDRRLAAYVVGSPPAGELRDFLAERLPAPMVPAWFVTLAALPVTANGKLDRAALPAPPSPGPSSGELTPAADRMAAIWGDVLGLEAGAIGPADDFFDLGGHSLLATRVIARVREEFGTDTPLRAIFQAPTLAGLVALVGAVPAPDRAATPLAARRRDPGERFPLTLAQEQMWALEAVAVPPGLYNITALTDFDAPVDVERLRAALATVVDRHDILRVGFGVADGAPYQSLAPAVTAELCVVDGLDTIAADDAAPFDLARPPLLRAVLHRLGGGADRLAVTFDHLVCDGTGAEIFMTELVAAYQHGPAALPQVKVQYVDYARWQREHVTEAVLRRQLDWWVGVLDGMPLGPTLPFDHVPDVVTRRIAGRPVDIGPATRARLEDVARATGSTVFTVAVAAVSALFGLHAGSTDVVFSTTLSGRTRAELEDLVGTFSGIGRLRTELSGDPTFAALVTRSRDRVLGMFENQDIPFLRVRRALLPDFPAAGPAVAAALPTELQYFHTTGHHELFFRGQLHPLSLTLLDDGVRLGGTWSWKLDYYDAATVQRLAGDLERLLDVVGADPSVRLSELPITR